MMPKMALTKARLSARPLCAAALAALAIGGLWGCGGGGGKGGDGAAGAGAGALPPAIFMDTAQKKIAAGEFVTLEWSVVDASACTASGGWSGAPPLRGAQSFGPLNAATSFTLDCQGPGGESSRTLTVEFEPLPPGVVLVGGLITFDRVSFKAAGAGLDPAAAIIAPVREAIVEAVAEADDEILATGSSHLNGGYALRVPSNRRIFVRVKAQMRRSGAAPNWNIAVRNNVTGGRLYALDSASFDTGTAGSTLHLHAASGWSAGGYEGVRAAAPFAILDTAFEARRLIVAAAPSIALPALDFYWSAQNRAVVGEFCPAGGAIGTSFYVGAGYSDQCATPGEVAAGIYLLGAFDGGFGDTDEFDQHVIAHEFGHYYEDRLSRSDSIGGAHAPDDRLDLRVAFGEGWGNAFASMVLDDPAYRDSYLGVAQDYGFDLEHDLPAVQGWFSEMSVGRILWDIFDDDAEPGDDVALGFAAIHAVMSAAQVNTAALTSIFSFAAALRSAQPAAAAAIRDLLAGENIYGTDAFGTDETNHGGDVLPIYQDIVPGVPLAGVCSRSTAGSEDGNKLGNSRFLRFENDIARSVTIQAIGAPGSHGTSLAATNPDIHVYRRGALVAAGRSTVAGAETISQLPLDPGTYIIEVYDRDLAGMMPPRCMSVSIIETGQ